MNAWILLALAAAHCLVDLVALFVQPLWPSLQQKLSTGNASIQWVYVFWTVSASMSQLLFGYWGDRVSGRWLLWAGPIVCVVCLSGIGYADSLLMLTTLIVVGGLGIGAFHPEAAAMVGACAPENRSRAMSVFVIGGTIGQAVGPMYSGWVSEVSGMEALIWSMAWGLPLAACMIPVTWAGSKLQTTSHSVDAPRPSFRQLMRTRGGSIGLVLAIGVMRVLPVMGTLHAVAFLLDQRGDSTAGIGMAQSVFQFSMGIGVLACALAVGPKHERAALWLLPLFATPALLAVPLVSYMPLLVCLAIAGLSLGGATPLLISYGQRLVPEGQRFISSITMGASWGLGGVLVAGAMAYFNQYGRPDLGIYVFAPCAALSSILCGWLPSDCQLDRLWQAATQDPQPTAA